MNISSYFPWVLLAALLMHGCAKQSVPTGGPKDTIPPQILTVFPQKNAVNFSGNKIEMTFNEFVSLDNPKEQILITPDVGKKFEITAKKKRVELTFEEKLQDSVTYSVNFREAVKDITEKNPAENLKIAFSTGSYIDSLSFKGTVKDQLINKEIKNATVAIYAADTFNIFSHKPSYISRTNDKGVFVLENLKPGTYYIYAFNDANRNLTVDSKTEAYAFDTTAYDLKRNLDIGTLQFIRLDARPIRLTSARPDNTYCNIKFSKGIDHYRVTSISADTVYSIPTDDRTSLKVYKTFTQDSLRVRVRATDSLAQSIDTTLYVKFSQRKSEPENFEIAVENWKLLTHKAILEGTLVYNKPIASINYDSISFQLDSANIISFTPSDLTWEPKEKRIRIVTKIDKKLINQLFPPAESSDQVNTSRSSESASPQSQLILGTAAFISVEYDSSRAMSETIRPLGIEETGIIHANVQTHHPHFVLELVDKSFKVVRRMDDVSSATFEDLAPGDYQLRLIIDSDNNGKWSAGNVLQKQQTESVKYYVTEKKSTFINLKANWEVGPLLISF